MLGFVTLRTRRAAQESHSKFRIGAFSPVGPSLAWCWIRVIQMDDDPLYFIQMDDDPYTFGHQPHALLSRPDLATKHRRCRLPG
jgi:hypothetical protein